MKEGPSIATIAALMGDPARANMLGALMAGRALTAGELAREAGVSAPTASGHLARLSEAGLVLVEAQGRHRYFRLSGPDVALVLEGLMGLAARTGRLRTRPGPRDPALRQARTCWDHMAGEWAVRLYDGLVADGRLAATDGVLPRRGGGRRWARHRPPAALPRLPRLERAAPPSGRPARPGAARPCAQPGLGEEGARGARARRDAARPAGPARLDRRGASGRGNNSLRKGLNRQRFRPDCRHSRGAFWHPDWCRTGVTP